MKITVPKSTLETALAPILKMAPAAKPSRLAIRAERQKVWLCRSTDDQRLDVELPGAACDRKDGGFGIANPEQFRLTVSAARGASLSVEQDGDAVRLYSDGSILGLLDSEPSDEDSEFQMPRECDSAVLPTGFAAFVLQAFACAGDGKDRPALSGVNVSSRGVAGSDGKQLFHLPLPLRLKEGVTLPPSKAYSALKHLRWTSLAHWKAADRCQMFRISGEGFRYTAKAVDAPYPEYWRILAAEDKCDARLTLTQESAQELQKFLDGNKEETSARLTVFPDRIVLLETDDKTRRQRTGVFEARCHGAGVPGTVHLDTRYLRQFLKMGFLSMSMSSKAPVPLASSSGIGKYLFMPMRTEAQSPVPDSNPAAASAPSVPEETTPKPQTKEKKTMTQTVNTTTTVTNPASFTKAQPTAVQSNPLDETLSSLVSMRETLSGLEARLLEAGRRIKAALVEQRLKERQYADATRKLERIRLAV